jgi:transposase
MTTPSDSLPAVLQAALMQVGGRARAVVEPVAQRLIDHTTRLEERVKRLEWELKAREEQLRLDRIRKYGPRGEKLSHDQVMLLDLEMSVSAGEVEKEAALPDAEKAVADAAALRKGGKGRAHGAPRYAKAHPGRQPFPAHLPREEVIIACEEAAGGELIGYEQKEELVIKPAEFFVRVIKREKRKLSLGGRSTIVTAPPPVRIVEKGQFDDSVVVELLVAKYCDHLPIYRQRQRWLRDHGLDLPDSALLRPVMRAADLLKALAGEIGRELKRGPLIQADETRVAVLQKEGKGRNDKAWFWQYSKPGGLVYFDYQDSRSRAGPLAFLSDYTGRIQSDAYEVYTPIGKAAHSHAGCWAHVRRKFDETRKVAPKEAPCAESERVLGLIAGLYVVEAEARERGITGAEARLELRQARDVEGKLEEIGKVIADIRAKALPASRLGKACDYALNQWSRLVIYARDGEIEIDNNWCENAMRPVALGRKNWLHLGSQESGPKVAAIMTVISSAQRAGLNVRDYLSDVLSKLSDPAFTTGQLASLLPENWKAARAATTGNSSVN